MCYVNNQWYDISCATLYNVIQGNLQHVSATDVAILIPAQTRKQSHL